ncbi:MAG: HAMP domain-containing sensor histidine kinase, partial [Pseudomonadales bacterium]
IQTRIRRLEQLLNDLLTFSKVGRGKEVCREIAVESMAKEIFDLSHPPKGFDLKVEGELPVFNTLAAPFELIMRNLISNAIKHHGSDTGTITLSARNADKQNFYEFSVSDDGQGIDPKYHSVVFEMFSSLRPKDEVEGTGMGLSIVEKIVRTYGGEIHLESDVGQGTTIRFLWPRDLDVCNF